MTAGDCNGGTPQLKRDARRLVTQLVSGEARLADFEEAKRWRRQSPAHDAAFAEATRLWQDLGAAGRGLLEQEGPPVWSPPLSPISRRAVLAGGGTLAAAGAAYAVVNPPLRLWPSFNELRADYRTATGEQRRLTLADHVSVRMNTQTSIAVPAAADHLDQVTLLAGEASFAIPPQSTRLFAVVADTGRTIASRARFDVRNSGTNVCVTCFEGDVRVEQGERAATVGPGRQVRYNREGLGDASTVNVEEAAAWRDGILIFRGTPLSDVVAELNRYRPGRIILVKAALAQKSVNGRFKIERIDEILHWIAQVYGATPRSLPGGVILLG
ncbi:FecR domain-containing protein [Bradyrhizobium neotropicale]|uniref:FecR family protein n=1 Tax=Bradyrhizobium neotropicale TaxID=1497615 RepID=UPI001AD7CF43|nr:FecR domain-containing protein [Bradyrhizobium neotropicale]MBO4224089.1 iron dicitrate transport regulator FecR [Bradyrhizobium neotropicale]